jgi:hypothetical protein
MRSKLHSEPATDYIMLSRPSHQPAGIGVHPHGRFGIRRAPAGFLVTSLTAPHHSVLTTWLSPNWINNKGLTGKIKY